MTQRAALEYHKAALNSVTAIWKFLQKNLKQTNQVAKDNAHKALYVLLEQVMPRWTDRLEDGRDGRGGAQTDG